MTRRSNPLFASKITTPQKIVDMLETGYKFCMMLFAEAHSMCVNLNQNMGEWKTNVEKTDKARREGKYEDINPEYSYPNTKEYIGALYVMFKKPIDEIKGLIDRYSFMRVEIYAAVEELKRILRHYKNRQYESLSVELKQRFDNIAHNSKELITKMKSSFCNVMDVEGVVDEHTLRIREISRVEELKARSELENVQAETTVNTSIRHRDAV